MKVKIVSVILLFGILYSCSNSDEGEAELPEFDYGQTLIARFYTEGSSPLPTVDWKGDPGQFGLENTVEGIALNPQTGVISWDKTLALGSSELKVIAFNNAGVSTRTVSVENRFEGEFSGTYTLELTATNLDLNFSQDGMGLMVSHGLIIREVPGTWAIDGMQITAEYPNPEESLTYWIDGELSQSKTGPKIEGKFSVGNQYAGAVGSFEVTLNMP